MKSGFKPLSSIHSASFEDFNSYKGILLEQLTVEINATQRKINKSKKMWQQVTRKNCLEKHIFHVKKCKMKQSNQKNPYSKKTTATSSKLHHQPHGKQKVKLNISGLDEAVEYSSGRYIGHVQTSIKVQFSLSSSPLSHLSPINILICRVSL